MKDMQWLFLLLLLFFLIQNIIARSHSQSQIQKKHNKSRSKQTSGPNKNHHQQHRHHHHHRHPHDDYQHKQSEYYTPQPHHSIEPLEVDILQCPVGCVCQYAHFMDLPIARWINHMQTQRPEKLARIHGRVAKDEEESELVNDNETAFEDDESFLTNPYIKQATCILQEDNDIEELIQALPHDLQALILLYTGSGKNKTATTSLLKPLNQLTTLEIRGSQDRSFRLVFDEPLSFLQHANFDSITLLGSDSFKRPKTDAHPSDSFDYRPKIELDFYATEDNNDIDVEGRSSSSAEKNGGSGTSKFDLQHPLWEDEIEILPYDIYLQEVRKARLPSFYGWERLEVLRIQSCQLKELHWEMFDGLDALEHLSLERNAIEMITALALFGANNIRTLSLAHNAIQDLHYRALGGLLQLELLDLSDNKIMKLSEMSFPPFPKLERADFRNNPIRHIFPATFGVMNKTRKLYFGSREAALELWNNEPFQWLDQLQELKLENISIGNLEHKVFQGLISLEIIKIKGAIRRIDFDAFADQSKLRELDLSDCGIQEISMDAFMGCKKLEIVNLARNNLTHIPPGLFDEQKNLEEIYLEGNKLRTLPANFFYNPKLKLARLNDNPWQCSCAMYNWRAKTTNQMRNGARAERCITDYRTGKRLSCRKVDNYQIDHRFAPRCENYNGRSVFYVIRKNIQCGQGRVVNAYNRRRSKSVKVDEQQRQYGQRHQMQEHKMNYTERHIENISREAPDKRLNLLNNIEPGDNRSYWVMRREEKIRRTLAQENSIRHVLEMQQQKSEEALTQANHPHYTTIQQNNFSNDI